MSTAKSSFQITFSVIALADFTTLSGYYSGYQNLWHHKMEGRLVRAVRLPSSNQANQREAC